MISDQREGVRMRRDQPRQHTHGRPGVPTIQRRTWLAEGSRDARNLNRRGHADALLDDRSSKRFHARERRMRVGPGRKVRETRGAFSEARQQGVPVRDGLVARNSEGTLQGAGGANYLRGHSLSSVTNSSSRV